MSQLKLHQLKPLLQLRKLLQSQLPKLQLLKHQLLMLKLQLLMLKLQPQPRKRRLLLKRKPRSHLQQLRRRWKLIKNCK